jgi:transcription elongation GreA/GreB family factor
VLHLPHGALIGLSEGQSIRYEADDGRARRLTVIEVLAQPEARRP